MHLVPFNTTNREKEMALRLGVPMYGVDPKFFRWEERAAAAKFLWMKMCHLRWVVKTLAVRRTLSTRLRNADDQAFDPAGYGKAK